MIVKNGKQVELVDIPEEGILLLNVGEGLLFEESIDNLLRENSMDDLDREIKEFFNK